MGRVQLLARIDASALAPQPLAVEQMRTGELRTQPGAAQSIDRLAVEASAASPSLSSARDRASMPSAQSVPAARRGLRQAFESAGAELGSGRS